MRLAISFKIPKKYLRGFGKSDKSTIKEFKKRIVEKLQPKFDEAVEEIRDKNIE